MLHLQITPSAQALPKMEHVPTSLKTWTLTLYVTSLCYWRHMWEHVHVSTSPGIVSEYYDVNQISP